MSNEDFKKCTKRVLTKDGYLCISCKMGLWSVEGRDHTRVENEARWYFEQYKSDGEYYKIIGGLSPTEVIIRGLNYED